MLELYLFILVLVLKRKLNNAIFGHHMECHAGDREELRWLVQVAACELH